MQNFQHANPLDQVSLSGLTSQSGRPVPYDKLDRFQLSKVCKKLGYRHKEAETHTVLCQLLHHKEMAGEVTGEKIMAVAKEVLDDEERARQGHAEHSTPITFYEPEKATAPIEAPKPDLSALLLKLAMAGHKELITLAHGYGLKDISSVNTREQIITAINEFIAANPEALKAA